MGKQWSGLDVVSDRLDAVADELGALVAPAERLSGSDTWVGPAADDARVAVAWATRGVGEAAAALRRLAAELRAEGTP